MQVIEDKLAAQGLKVTKEYATLEGVDKHVNDLKKFMSDHYTLISRTGKFQEIVDEKFSFIDDILEGNSKKFNEQKEKNEDMLMSIDAKANKFALDKMAESMKRYSILEDYKDR